MPDSAWPISTALTTANAITADCNTCHGDSDGADLGYSWPDGSRVDPDDNAGAHQAHVDAIAAGAGISAIGGATCDRCHTGNSHATGTVDFGFTNVSGAADGDGNASGTAGVSITCTNIDCHGAQSPTPNWYGDTTAPVFSNTALTVANPITGGDLQITWFAATDADTPPVSYDLYRLNNNTTGNACTDGARILVASDLGALSYLDTGLTDGTPYRYCVQAKDSVTPTANTANSQSNHNTPTAAPTSQQTDYYLTKNTGTLIYTGQSTNAAACGTLATIAQVASGTYPVNARYALQSSLACASNTNNMVRMTGTSTAGVYRNLGAFYKLTAESAARTATMSVTGTSLGLRSSANAEDVQIYLAAVNGTGTHSLSTSFGQITNITSAAMANWTPTIAGTASVSVPASSRLAVLVRWADTSATSSANDQMAIDNYNGTIQPRVRITETIPADTLAPAFAGNNSGITASDAGSGGAATVSWNAATDVYPSNPVRYTVYGISSATQPSSAALFVGGNIVQNNLTSLTTTVTGLVNGTNYYWFGVRATDAANNVETANTTITTPGVTPTGGGGGVVCGDCHAIPPATGAHAEHADGDADYTDCEACHGTVAGGYTTTPSGTHNNGSASFVAAITYSNSGTTANKSDDTCFTTICHNQSARGVGSATWTLGGANCNACHYNSAGTNGLTADHAPHLAAAVACSSCHTVPASLAVHALDATGAANDGASLTDRAAALQDEATVTAAALGSGSDPDAGNPTCNNAACHNPSATTYSAQWLVSASSCTLCHSATDPTTDSHTGHLGAGVPTTYGRTFTCLSCHPNHAGVNAHRNGSVNVQVPINTVMTAVATPTAAGACGTNDCHRADLANVAPVRNTYQWGVALTDDCASCHAGTGIATRNHGAHLLSNSLPATNLTYNTTDECRACHSGTTSGTGLASGAQHIDNGLDVSFFTTYDYEGTTVTAGSTGAGDTRTCSDVRCHNGRVTPTWAAASTVACGDCHGSGTAGNGAAHEDLLPAGTTAGLHGTAAQMIHANSDATFTDCDYCHGNATYNVSGSRGASAYTAIGGGGATPSGIHQNLLVEVYINSSATLYTDTANTAAGVNWNSAGATHDDNGTCGTTTVCHNNDVTGGAGRSGAWNTAYTGPNNCTMCHSNGADAVADAAGADSVDDQWTSRGHGSALGGDLDTDLLSDDGGCDFCHLDNMWQDHLPTKNATNPYRLRINQTTNDVCLACHGLAGGRGLRPAGGEHGDAARLLAGRRGDARRPQALRRRGRHALLGLPRGARRVGDEHPHGQGQPERDLQHVRAADLHQHGGGLHGAGGGLRLRRQRGADHGAHLEALPEVPRQPGRVHGGERGQVLALRRHGGRGRERDGREPGATRAGTTTTPGARCATRTRSSSGRRAPPATATAPPSTGRRTRRRRTTAG